MLINRIHGVRPCGIGRGWQHVIETTGANNIRRMSAARAFGMIGMYCPSFKGGHRVLDKTGLVKGIGMNRNLYVIVFGNAQTVANRCRRGAPVFV